MLRIMPADIDDRLPTAPPAVVESTLAIAIGNAGIPVVEGNLELRYRERLGDGHLMSRAFAAIAASFLRERAHGEGAGRDRPSSWQSSALSLKVSPDLSACSAEAVSTHGRNSLITYGRMVVNQRHCS